MSRTIDLKDPKEFNAYKMEIIEDINDCNPVDESGFPLDAFNKPITTDWLWEEYGHHLDGTQTGLGYQLFNEVIAHYENHEPNAPISDERIKEIKVIAESDWLDDYKIGKIKLIDTNEVEVYGLNHEELKVYVDAYNALVNE